MVHQAEICVVGGGIAGLCCARALARRGVEVALVDRDGIGRGTSSVAGGMLAPLIEAKLEEREVVEFGRDALNHYPDFVLELEEETGRRLDYRREGTLIVGVERDHIAQIEHLHEEHVELGLPVERLTGHECRKIEPCLAPSVAGGIFSPADHQIDNRLLLKALAISCRDVHRVKLYEETGELTLREGENGIVLVSESLKIRAERYVVATGAERSVFTDIAPEIGRALRPVKGQVIRLDQSRLHLLDHVLRTPEMYLAPKSDGTIALGASSEDQGFDRSVTLGPIFELLRAAWEAVPGVYELPIVETAVGFRPATLDHAPMLGETSLPGVFMAAGYYRHGILFAPLAAELLAERILRNQHDERLDRFSPQRFDRNDAGRAERQADGDVGGDAR